MRIIAQLLATAGVVLLANAAINRVGFLRRIAGTDG